MFIPRGLSYSATDSRIEWCCYYGVGTVIFPSAEYVLLRPDTGSLVARGRANGGAVNFSNHHCFGINFTLIVARMSGYNFIVSLEDTFTNCTDPSHSVIPNGNIITVNVTNITNRVETVSAVDRYVVFTTVVRRELQYVLSTRKSPASLNKYKINENCINDRTGYTVPIYNPIQYECSSSSSSSSSTGCQFMWSMSSIIYHTFVYQEDDAIAIKCTVNVE